MIYLMDKVRNFFTDKNGKPVVWQTPNAPLIAWFIFLLLAKALPSHSQVWASYLSTASLLIWSVLEVRWGASYFRRTLGALVLIMYLIKY